MNCNDIQERMAEDLNTIASNSEVTAHLETCAACRKIAERLRQVDQAMAHLPMTPIPDELVKRTVDAVDKQAMRPKGSARLILAIATPVALVLVVGVVGLAGVSLMKTSDETRSVPEAEVEDTIPGRFGAISTTIPEGSEGRRVYSIGVQTAEASGRKTDTKTGSGLNGQLGPTGGIYWQDGNAEYYNFKYSEGEKADQGVRLGHVRNQVDRLKSDEFRAKARLELLKTTDTSTELPPASGRASRISGNKDAQDQDKPDAILVVDGSGSLSRDVGDDEGWHRLAKKGDKGEGKEAATNAEDLRRELDGKRANRPLAGDMTTRKPAVAGKLKEEDDRTDLEAGGLMGERGKDNLEWSRKVVGQGYLKIKSLPPSAQVVVDGKQVDASFDQPVQLSQGRHRVTLSRPGYKSFETNVVVKPGKTKNLWVNLVPLADLKFIEAQGYFENTYLPGDPEIEWLKSRLAQGIFLDGRLLSLEKAVAPYRQPFDAPASDGLAAYLSTDRTSLDAGRGPTRMTLQVGLRGSDRHARRRAALNAALVVDLRQTPPEDARRILWALADAMASDQQAGDRFSLVVAGADKPLVMTPKDFKPGAVRLSLARTLQTLEKSSGSQDLGPALKAAYQAVIGDGAEDAPIGANLVLLASAAPLADQTRRWQTLVHKHAVGGVTLSTIGVGARADRDALGSLAQAGQGRRRLVVDLSPAGKLIEDELSASGRVVARAVRLRIRLAEGVKLVEVLGSGPLDAMRSERVRQAENAIDQRVAKTLGVKADRGEDEDGIQIVIPAYYAGDDHVILLDVVVPGPGKVADLQVRYKDLVNLDNAVARARLNLPSGYRPDDPLARNVRKNLLAYRTSQDLLRAGNQLNRGAAPQAVATLARAAKRLDELCRLLPELADDPEMIRDAGMLAEYQRVLNDYPLWQNNHRIRLHLARSLVYAGKVKLPPGAGLVARR